MNAPMTKEQYDPRWIAKVKAKCSVNEKGCWIWPIKYAVGTKYGTKWAYGKTNYRDKTCIIHRKMYEVVHDVTLTRFQFVCHSCDETMCCNPEHLWLGSPKENSMDASSKGRSRNMQNTHCKRGHEFTPENTRLKRPWVNSGRVCMTCVRGRLRIKAGWSEAEAFSTPAIPPNVATARRHWRKAS